MNRKKKVNVVLHHNLTDTVRVSGRFSLFKSVYSALFSLLYNVGSVVLAIILFPWNVFNLLKGRGKIPKRTFDLWHKKMISFALLLLIAVTPLVGLNIASEGKVLSGRVLGIGDDAISNLKEAQTAITNQDYAMAQNKFADALSGLQNVQAELDSSSLILRSTLSVMPDTYSATNMLRAAQLLSESGRNGARILELVKSFKISPQGIESQIAVPELFTELIAKSTAIEQAIKEASDIINSFSENVIPDSYLAQFIATKSLINDLGKKVSGLPVLLTLFSDMVLGNKNILIVMQNNNELRPNGGFIGTVGTMKLENGAIKKLDIRSVYDFDGQLKDWILPPKPMVAVNDRWYLRDSNWFANFSDSAKRMSVFYEKEGGETPDMVVALTPDVFIELLNLTGPIVLPTYGVTINASNFIEQIQTSTSIAYDKQLNQPKQLLADLYPALMQKLSSQLDENILQLFSLLQKDLQKKNIIIFSRNQNIQDRLEQFNWAGAVSKTDRDYLQLVSANLGGTKTDRSLQRSILVETVITSDKQVRNKVSYTVTNPLPNNPALSNSSFVRLLVPAGSSLTASYGFSENQLPNLSGDKYSADPVAAIWNDGLSFNSQNNTYVGNESGKTFFGGWVKVNGGSSATITLEYEIPFKISNLDRYSLLLQKQPGMIPFQFDHKIIYGDNNYNLKWQNFSGEPQISNGSISYNSIISADKFGGVILERK